MQPNILLLIADQFRGDCLSIEGHPVLLTPNLDDMAAGGTRFQRAYSTCPSCVPARRAFLTGVHPGNNGMVGMEDGHEITTPTFPAALRDAGYQTVHIGRMQHQYPPSARYGYEHMVSTYFNKVDDAYGRDLSNLTAGVGDVKGNGVSNNGWGARPWHLPEPLHPTSWVVRKNREFLREADETCPLFLTASFQGPHPPLIPPAFYMDRYLRADLPEPVIGDWAEPAPAHSGLESAQICLKGEALRSMYAGYFGMINHIDDELYWLIQEFKRRSQEQGREWVILFTADHGEMLGDHHLFRKCVAYEGSARIPYIWQGSPGMKFKEGQAVTSPVCLEDIFPTLIELAGAPEVPGLDGKSLVPVLRGEKSSVREILHGEHAQQYGNWINQANQYLTDGQWKYIWHPLTGNEELFDLVADPGETRNQINVTLDVADKFRNTLVHILEKRPENFVVGGKLQIVKNTPKWIG